ncbi:hypothetical protein TVAG_124980 [Trichomonas vaginalis G3]|uniref:Amino acid transporter transmembrane domain-containing protein n=1 Tax=Trichomonas vaginalis (strain ATCC PRA-98 / G3) TaxID=412133 RepID=A2EIK4_TRIV3|nr:amino acid transmembrane transporter protein [Trichomonas vaginalis G3]EAY07525.1 hypothetical protein TVAG_124980 [Trichomonas vaginalis G3]KAI5550521.1 amino acid transmembrane transporter protein [Trichomonas vaginalis G3]|eukprot:XP_001319748.1 hypothetical protein [Trichomonas vaginalis G3]
MSIDTPLIDKEETSTVTEESTYTGFIESSFNMINTCLGAGILSISNSFTFCGLIPSTITLSLSALFSYISAHMIIKMHTLCGINSFMELSVKIGKFGKILTDISVILFCYSCMIAYVIMSVEILQSWFMLAGLNLKSFWRRTVTVIVFCFGLPFMLTIPRNIKFLSSISFFCVIAVLMYFVGLVYKGIAVLPKDGIHPTTETYRFNMGIFNCIAVHFLCFSVSCLIIPVVKVMRPNMGHRSFT